MADFRPPGAEPYDAALQTKLKEAIASMGPSYIPRTHHLVGERAPKYANRLVLETSPYLLQHAHNPVNWFPWGDEAFAEAKRLKRPVFLSSGYSTCHWCHVMEEESFENVEIAEFLNSHYVCIKLDREERPDVDAIYMTAVQAIHGSGGWPMSVWLTDAREPFFAGTYFPPHDGRRGARVGFLSLLKSLAELYHKEPDRVKSNASMLVDAIRGEMEAEGGPDMGNGDTPVDAAAIEKTVATVKRIFDHKNGGVRRAPKFPSNIPVRLLLRYHRRTGDAEALHMATLTLEKMAGGGMHDQLGGGFHRYSTDAEWLAPHFEKMLYDNALLAVAYAEAHQATGRADFARTVRMTLDYVLREMTSPEGGFYSATDADSEGEEGRFFVWSEEEVRTVLGSGPMTDRFVRFYDVTSGGNWEGHNILRTLHPDEAEWHALAAQRAALYEARSKRVPPLRDEKILASWNGLMISAMAIAGRILDESRYIQAAERALLFIVERMRVNGKIARSYKGGKVGASAGFLDDYAFVSAAALDLYEATLEKRWLLAAQAVAEEMQAMFGDAKSGGWFKTSLKEHETLIAREKSASDGAEPAGASVALLTCVRLAASSQRKEWSEAARRGLSAIGTLLNQQPLAVTEALLAIDYLTDSVLDIAIIWPDDRRSAAEALFGELRRHFVPNRAICGAAQSEIADISKIVPWMAEKAAVRGAATAFVCESTGTCKLPAQTPADLAAALGAPKAYGARGAASAAASLH